MVVSVIAGVVLTGCDVVIDEPKSSTQWSSTFEAPRCVVIADAAITSVLDCILNIPLDDRPQVLHNQISKT